MRKVQVSFVKKCGPKRIAACADNRNEGEGEAEQGKKEDKEEKKEEDKEEEEEANC